MAYAALSGFGETIKTEGNQNNELGMPRTASVTCQSAFSKKKNILKTG